MNSMAEVADKRRFPRVAVQGHLRYRGIPITAKNLRNAMIQDLSQGGLRFRSEELLNRKASMLLELHLSGSHPVRSLASVAWVKAMPDGNGYEIGGMFVEPTHEARVALERSVQEFGAGSHA